MNSPSAFDLGTFMEQCQQRIQSVLKTHLEALPPHATQLRQAMQYACLQGGKRVRPLLVYAGAQAFGAQPARVDIAACAVELIHCYSLVHDDLPAMDDDDLRRGNPTVHIAFNEATAILAGDALQGLAFRLLSDPEATAISDSTRLRMINLLAAAGGYEGMVELVREIDRAIYNPVWQQVRIPAPWGDDGETLSSVAAAHQPLGRLADIAAKAMGLEPEEVPV